MQQEMIPEIYFNTNVFLKFKLTDEKQHALLRQFSS